MSQKIIDIHPHIISPDTARYPHSPIGGIRSDWSSERPFTFEQYVAEMGAAGVSQAAMVQSATIYGYDNAYAADSVCRDPARFVGIYTVDVGAPDPVATIEGWRRRGMAGLRLFGAGSTVQTDGRWMIEPATWPVWEHMAEIDMTVAIQTTSIGLPVVEEIVERFPEVNFVLDHLGRPDLTDGAPCAKAAPLWKLARFGNLFLKITPRTFDLAEKAPATPESFFPKLVAEYGADRLAWGSNFPANPGVSDRHGIRQAMPVDWRERFIEAYDQEFREGIMAAGQGTATGPSTWDGYAATLVADAALRAVDSGRLEPVAMRDMPALYGTPVAAAA